MPNGQFQWSPELQELLAMLQERMGFALDYPTGITPEERNLILSSATERVQAGERPAIEASKQQMARFGLGGTPAFEGAAEAKIRRGTREGVADVTKAFSIDEINRKFQELTGTTNIASNLMSRLFDAEQMPEMLSGARRAEGFRASDQLLNYLSILMGGQQGMLNPMMGAISSRFGGGQQGGMGSWLPFLAYYLMQRNPGTTN
jgi:hypothetical protein